MIPKIFTHRANFGLCPVYIADVDTDAPFLEPVYPYTSFLLALSVWFYGLLFWLFPFANPRWPLSNMRRMRNSVVIEVEQ